jgi:hypothetical protein
VFATAAALSAAPASAQATQLFPGVTYENTTQFTPQGPVAIRVVRGPRPVGLYRLRTVLSHETVLREETLSSMQRRLASQATMVGINGDFSRIADGKPSGILLRDGILVTPPNAQRSSVGVGLDGTLDVRRVRFFGTWRGTGQRRALNDFNDAPGKNGITLFTSDWGRATPRVDGSFSVVLGSFPASVPNADLVAPVIATSQNAPVALAPGTAVLTARGNAAAKLQAEAAVGTNRTRSAAGRCSCVMASRCIGRTRPSPSSRSRRATRDRPSASSPRDACSSSWSTADSPGTRSG